MRLPNPGHNPSQNPHPKTHRIPRDLSCSDSPLPHLPEEPPPPAPAPAHCIYRAAGGSPLGVREGCRGCGPSDCCPLPFRLADPPQRALAPLQFLTSPQACWARATLRGLAKLNNPLVPRASRARGKEGTREGFEKARGSHASWGLIL